MADCSNLTNTTVVNLTKGTLPGGFCHSSLQDTYEKFIEATTAATISGSTYVTTDDEPTGDDLKRVWLKQDGSACVDPLGWYYHNGSDWSNPVPVPDAALADQSGLSAGTYTSVTVTAKGIITAGSSPSHVSVAALQGTVANAGTIPLPSGYDESQCKWIVGVGSISSSHGDHNAGHNVTFTATGTRTVTTSGIGTGSGTANYLIIGVK